jgi:hypothetical protein
MAWRPRWRDASDRVYMLALMPTGRSSSWRRIVDIRSGEAVPTLAMAGAKAYPFVLLGTGRKAATTVS